MPEIERVSYRHEGILNWLVANPHRSLKECAAELGFTQAWLSTIIHSDAFQMLYQERMKELGGTVVHTVKDRLCGVAALALERTAEKLEAGCSEEFLQTTTKNVLGALGFAPQRGSGGQPVQVQTKVELHLDEKRLLEARERARNRFTETPVLDVKPVPPGVGAPGLTPVTPARAFLAGAGSAAVLPAAEPRPPARQPVTLDFLLGKLDGGSVGATA